MGNRVRLFERVTIMKKLCFLAAVLCVLCASAAAAPGYYTIRDLPAATSPRWVAQYEAHGRLIQVDVDVIIPDADGAPVLTVEQMPPLSAPLCSQLEAWCAQAEREDAINRYAFRSNGYSTLVTHALPPAWGHTRYSEFITGAMGQKLFDLYAFDMDTAYADNNALTVAEAVDIIKKQAAALFPEEALHLRTVYVDGGTYWKKTGEPIRQKGGYALCLSQAFHGIPFMASIHQAYTQFALGAEDPWLENRGLLRATVFDENAWSLNCVLYREGSTVHEDIPLLPFDAVKSEVEDLILSGHVRWVDSVTLGYVQFDTSSPEEQLLIPCWVVWCEYHPAGAASQRQDGLNSSASLMYDGNSDYYRPLIISAQTGQLVNPESANEARCQAPQVMLWKDAQ